MIEIEIKNIKQVTDKIEKLGRGLSDNRYLLMKRLSETMYQAVQQNFRQGGRPQWLGIKHRRGKPLSDTGALRNSLSTLYDNDTAIVGTNLVYAAIHNFGGMAGRGRKVAIPQREFLTLTPEDHEDLMHDVQDYFASLVD